MNRRTLLAALLLSAVSLLAHAHEGMIHVMGIVTALTDKSVTVEPTDKKTVEVVLTATTTYEKGAQASTWKELKVGDRVVIHAVKVKSALQAHSVRFTEAGASH
ncbi:MAG TPA: DUF5666 domain-containing protein [Candidatus Binatia bacterium]|nr:DUF5666 domain-containing protein [Candidatus Binatia bacterium]